jgi:crotonobetainyl-CoA:carnitine CoA-transferase CaiB-like acyl-CoA transferase
LLRVGAYFMGWDMNIRLRLGAPATPTTRRTVPNPLVNCYFDSVGRWFWLLGLQGDRHWPDILRAAGKPELREDPRFNSMAGRRENAAALVELLDAVFKTRLLADWAPIFDRENVWWAPVQTIDELINDPQARAAGVFVKTPTASGDVEMVATPVDFNGTPWSVQRMSPEFGQNSEEVLLELGKDWEEIARLKAIGAIP